MPHWTGRERTIMITLTAPTACDGPLLFRNPMAGASVLPIFEPAAVDVARQDQEVVELPLLLPRWQALELEAAARRRGMTTGQMLRRMIGDVLDARRPIG